MTRNMKNANRTIFTLLDDFCQRRGDPLANANATRWIATIPEDRKFLKNAQLSDTVAFSPSRRIARFDFYNESYFCTVGFEGPGTFSNLSETDLNGAILTAFLAEAAPQPTATPIQIKNRVEAIDGDADRNFQGYAYQDIATFYPLIRVFTGGNVDESETWKIFFRFCILENRGVHSWIEDDFLDTLESICDLGLLNIPYGTLCRSIFDIDPAAMYLALYRCMEAIYAYSSATKVVRGLGLTQPWPEVAEILENELGWYPREEGSLIDLMAYAINSDLEVIFDATGEQLPDGNLAAAAARRIYKLRNSLVHYRPSQQREDFGKIKWNALCVAMANIVCNMYAGVFLS